MSGCDQKPDNASATLLFPDFDAVPRMVTLETNLLTQTQLDWESDNWDWSTWSIRRQVGHIASFIPSWLLDRWGHELYPQGLTGLEDFAGLLPTPEKTWRETGEMGALPSLVGQVELAVRFALYTLGRETIGSLRAKEVVRPNTPPHWRQFVNAHPRGVRWDLEDANTTYVTLEASFRHLYFEAITHLYNIQRLKRAQGIGTVVNLPEVGYWRLPDWDRSEP
jgi:hypothetical protein